MWAYLLGRLDAGRVPELDTSVPLEHVSLVHIHIVALQIQPRVESHGLVRAQQDAVICNTT